MIEGRLERRCPVDRLHILPDLGRILGDLTYALLQLEGTSTTEVMVVVIVVMKVDWCLHKSPECSLVEFVKLLHSSIRVAEERDTALFRCSEAVEELQSWRLLHVEKIHMETKVYIGVSNILCI